MPRVLPFSVWAFAEMPFDVFPFYSTGADEPETKEHLGNRLHAETEKETRDAANAVVVASAGHLIEKGLVEFLWKLGRMKAWTKMIRFVWAFPDSVCCNVPALPESVGWRWGGGRVRS